MKLTPGVKEGRIDAMGACQLNGAVELQILQNVSSGNKLADAAREAGVAGQTVRNWVKWGEAGKEPYAAFVKNLRVAEVKPRNKAMKAWQKQMGEDWRAAKAFVEYLDKQQTSPESIARQVDEILGVVEDVLGQDAAKKVLRELVERSGGAEAGEPGGTLRLVTSG